MDLCVWARNKTTVYRRAKSSESCSWKKHFESDCRLFLRQNWSCGDCSTWASQDGQFWVVHHDLIAQSLRRNSKNEQEKTNQCSHISFQNIAFWPAIESMGHPPCSPKLQPNGFFLFQHIKKKLIVGTKKYCWSVQKACFGGVSIKISNFMEMSDFF